MSPGLWSLRGLLAGGFSKGRFLGLGGLSLMAAIAVLPGAQLPAGKDLTETGVPEFVVLGPESIGLNTAPTDLRLLPDGRILLLANHQLALGDGVRWEVFLQDPSDPLLAGQRAAVANDGAIYVGTPRGPARVDFQESGQWRLNLLSPWTAPGAGPPAELPDSSVDMLGRDWLWHALSGSLIAWHPGQSPRVVGSANTFECVFELGGGLYLSDRSGGALNRLEADKMVPVRTAGTFSAITCAQPFDPGRMLVGTYGSGLQLFDGRDVQAFAANGILGGGNRINDLCATAGGHFAAAVDNYGIVFLDREGRAIQVLDRSLDQRLARVKRLMLAPGGVLWGLLDGGVVRAAFPSRISYFEPLLGAGVTTVHPFRFQGRLWWLADGKTYRGEYDRDNRLERLQLESPAKLFANSFSGALEQPVVGTEEGAYRLTESGWTAFAPGLKSFRILDPRPVKGRWLYCAREEVGWLENHDGRIELVQRIRVPGLTNVYNNPVRDAQGSYWLELGIGQVARVQVGPNGPVARVFTARDGVSQSWPQTFVVDGVIGFNFSDQLYRFDEAAERFVSDQEFIRRLPGVKTVFGRPGLDAQDRLWASADGKVQVFQRTGSSWSRLAQSFDPGFLPYYFTFEGDGVVWMHALHRLARYDPALAAAPVVPLKALITRASVHGTPRDLAIKEGRVRPLPFAENSLVINFVATGSTFVTPAIFEVKLDGLGREWVNNGSTGSVSFGGLKEGDYHLHVRPRSGSLVGAEADLAFTILAPWYRSTLAYFAYAFGGVGLLWLAAALTSLLQRRKNARLERLVAERTQELNLSNARLNESNRQLAGKVEEIRTLSQAIDQSPVAVFLVTVDGAIEFANPCGCILTGFTLTELSRMKIQQLRSEIVPADIMTGLTAAMARGESWRGQLVNQHKDGRTIHVRSTCSPIRSPEGQVPHYLILEEDITEWLLDRERSHQLEVQLFQAQKMESIGTLAGGIAHDFNNILTGILGYCELTRLAAEDNLEVGEGLQQIRVAGLRAKDLVAQILTFSRQSQARLVPLDLAGTVAEALKLIRASTPSTVTLSQNLESGTVRADATQIHQIVVNLCTNAIHAMSDRSGRLEVTVRPLTVDHELAARVPNLAPGACMCLTVSDNGHGMDQVLLDRIFDPFFTTKAQGKGTGLGLAIVQGVVASHGGALAVHSQVKIGTTFNVYFPLSREAPLASVPELPAPRGNGQEILVVDDEEQVAAYVSARLRHFGYHPFVFHDPRQALASFLETPARFSVVVTDLTMPHLTGLDLLKKIRQLRPSLPVIIITGYSRDLAGEKLEAISRCIVLQKPFSGEELGLALRTVLEPAPAAREQ